MTTSGVRVVFRPVAIATGLLAATLLAGACGSSSGHPASAPAPVVSSTTKAPTTTTTTLAKPEPFDPTRPESLVYENRGGKQQIAAAMFMLPFGSRFTDAPDVGGALTQWHVHADLCLTDSTVQKTLSGLVAINGVCPAGSSKAGDTPMLHVWVVPNPCGPFAALEGVGAGQVPAGQTKLCDTAHGSTSSG